MSTSLNRSLTGETKNLGSFTVERILPNPEKRMVGPFIFLDHAGPATFAAGDLGINVRPHPHIGLATITYLLDGHILHRDSLGNIAEIAPGDVNVMIAGRGIVHSERESIEQQAIERNFHGLQSWIALPKAHAEIEPDFISVVSNDLPHYIHDGVTARLIMGEALGMASPIKTFSPMFYVDIIAQADKPLPRPNQDQECLLHVINGSIDIDGKAASAGDSILLHEHAKLQTNTVARCVMLGGEAWPETPHLFWNLVSFDKDRIEQAKHAWRDNKFPHIAQDHAEHIPLPD